MHRLAFLVLLLSGCPERSLLPIDGGARADAVPRPEPSGLRWEDCGPYRCTFLDVPIDHARLGGATLRLRVVRIAAEGPSLGTVVVNFGGPGVAGIATLSAAYPALRALAPAVRRFDVVSFDPRGIGESTPALHCADDDFFDRLRAVDYAPDDLLEHAELDALTDELAAGCTAAGGALLGHLDTESVARDLDLLRAALGEEEIRYLGISYGTWLGATYATLFPERVEAMVLDSPVAPAADRRERTLLQARGYEDGLERFAAWCGATPECAFHGGEGAAAVLGSLDGVAASLDGEPLAVGARAVGPTDLFACLHQTLRDGEGAWPELGRALHEAEAGDGERALGLADRLFDRREDGTYSTFLSTLLAVSALDVGFPAGLGRAEFDAFVETEVVPAAPRMGRYLAALDRFVLGWPIAPARPRPLDGTGVPILVVIGAHDPATPRDGALLLADALGEDALRLEVESDGHVQLLVSSCAREVELAFAIDPTAPLLTERCE